MALAAHVEGRNATEEQTKKIVWGQFGAAIDALKRAINACPEDLWTVDDNNWQFWVVVHHTLFWLDYYLTESLESYKPPPPFGLEELDPAGKIPEHAYTKEEMLTWLEHGRTKCKTTIMNLTDEQAERKVKFGKLEISFAELLLYNMRHVQHHTAQLNLFLRKRTGAGPRWVFTAGD